MRKILLLIILQNFLAVPAKSQAFTIRDLKTSAYLTPGNIRKFMNNKGFVPASDHSQIDLTEGEYIQKKKKGRKRYSGPIRSVHFYIINDTKYFILHTTSLSEFLEGKSSLAESGFDFDKKKQLTDATPTLFRKGNITIEATPGLMDGAGGYTFKLMQQKIPDAVLYAEDLLQFDSNDFLASYFGEKNVREDLYYFSEKELKKCSVLFSGTRFQAAFIWGDETNKDRLSYIIVSNILPTESNKSSGVPDGVNEWKFHNGLRLGMTIKDLLRLNEMDFYIYGNKSDLAFMVAPDNTGKLDFKKTGVMFRCSECYDNAMFDQQKVSALDIAKAHLPLRVFDIIIFPAYKK